MKMAVVEPELGIDFPFQVTLAHPPLNVQRMLELSRLLDFHEVRAPDARLEKARHDLVVDVIYVRETETKIEIKPRANLSYEAIATELEAVIAILAARFNGKVKVTELNWLVDRKGMASDMRAHQKRVL